MKRTTDENLLICKEAEARILSRDIIALKRKLKVQPYCCPVAEARNGWAHSGDCENWVLVY